MTFPGDRNNKNSKKEAEDFESLLRPHLEYLYRISYRFTGSREDAEDLVQDLVLKLYPRKKELFQVSKLRPWLVRVLYRLFLDQKRKNKFSPLRLVKSPQENQQGDRLEEIPGSTPNPEELLQQQNLGEKLEKALNKLSREQRAIITLHDIEGYSLTELEPLLEVPLGTLKSRLQRSREKMKKILQKDGTF